MQIQTLLAVTKEEEATERSNVEPNVKVAKPLIFSGEARNIAEFITACKLFLKMKMRRVTVEAQI